MKKKILVVVANYYKDISADLTIQASVVLSKKKIKTDWIKVPGIFEIPVIISKNIKKYDGFIALGCVIKGETANFDLISRAITDGIMQLSISHKKPIGNSIITSFSKDQALKRFDRGKEAAKAVLEVLKIK